MLIRSRRDEGSATTEFVLVSTFVLVLFLAVVQVALLLHVRGVVVSSAAEGARIAASADRDCTDGVARFAELVQSSVGERVVDGVQLPVRCSIATAEGFPAVLLEVDVEVPLLFAPGGSVTIRARAHALREGAS